MQDDAIVAGFDGLIFFVGANGDTQIPQVISQCSVISLSRNAVSRSKVLTRLTLRPNSPKKEAYSQPMTPAP